MCMMAAVYQVVNELEGGTNYDHEAIALLRRRLGRIPDVNLEAWNDADGRTKEEVLAILEDVS